MTVEYDPGIGIIKDLCYEFRVKWGPMDAEFRMAEELIELNKIIFQLEEKIERLKQDNWAFYRKPPPGGQYER